MWHKKEFNSRFIRGTSGLFLLIFLQVCGKILAEGNRKLVENCENPESARIVTEKELSSKDGENDSEIWLSMLGKVYDVTKGIEFYGKGAGYGGLAAKDASVGFVTGVFTIEESKKIPSEVLEDTQYTGLHDWTTFYEDEEKYSFVGYLQGIFYDENGKPTDELDKVNEKIKVQLVKREEALKARKAALKARRLKRQQQKK